MFALSLNHRYFPWQYRILLPNTILPKGVGEPMRFDDPVYTAQFLRQIDAPPNFWRSLVQRFALMGINNQQHSAFEKTLVNLFIRGTIRLIKIDNTKPKLLPHQRTFTGPANTQVELVPAMQLFAEGRQATTTFDHALPALKFLEQLQTTAEQRQVLAQQLDVPAATLRDDEKVKASLAQAIVAGQLGIIQRENRTQLKYQATEEPAPPPKPKTLGPHVGAGGQRSVAAQSSEAASDLPQQPKTLGECERRLEAAKVAVQAAKASDKPLPESAYSLEDKLAVVKSNDTERFMIRVIESKYAQDSGYLAAPRDHGATISWVAPFTMVEHGDTDAEALLNAFGTRHDPSKDYTVLIIDSDKLNELADIQTIIPTHKNLQKLLKDNPQITSLSSDVCEQVLSDEFSPKYYKFAKGMAAAGVNQKKPVAMRKFAKEQGFSDKETKLLEKRHQLARDISAWEEFTGNGMTLDTNVKGKTAYGPVELVMLDKAPQKLGVLEKKSAISLLSAS